MLTLDAAGKSGSQAIDFVRDSLNDNEDEFKILIDGPSQSDGLTNFLESEGFSVILEDDDGTLFLMATRDHSRDSVSDETEPEPEIAPEDLKLEPESQAHAPIIAKNHVIKDSSAVVISYETKKYMPAFTAKFINSLKESKIRPDVIVLMNCAVSLATYNSRACASLKELEASGVEVLVSESCADRMGLTEALGAGTLADMVEIIERIFSCEKVVSL